MPNFTDIKVELIDSMGSDLTVVNAARVSFDKQSEWNYLSTEYYEDLIKKDLTPEEVGYQILKGRSDSYSQPCYGILNEKDVKLIRYLASHNHWTPFSHSQITMRETVPIPIARQRFKHMVGFTYNEVSRRYVDTQPEFFDIKEWRNKSSDKKQGSSGAHPNTDFISKRYKDLITEITQIYNLMIHDGVAPEQARMILPLSSMTSYYVTGSLYAFARAYKLRASADAQQEIQYLADGWNKILSPLFPVSWPALTFLVTGEKHEKL